jgi:hypothetical protein
MASWMFWLLLGLSIASVLAFAVVWKMQQSFARERAIKQFLDAADALERDLYDCKKRMQAMQDWLARFPSEGTRQVSGLLNADASVATALKLVLSRRLWLRDQHNTASLSELKAAQENLATSSVSLAENISKLETMREELERAADQLETAAKAADRSAIVASSVVAGTHNHTIH